MDTRPLSVWQIFGQDRRLVVPLFQRPYVWTQGAQWELMWRDILFVSERLLGQQAVRPHFMGAIVLDQLRKPTGHLDTRLIVDGQQRLTTIQLLLESLCDICSEKGIENYRKALWKLTRNDDPMSKDPDEQFKVWPTNVDREHFRRVMAAGSPSELRASYGRRDGAWEVGHPIADGYLFFFRRITEWLAPAEQGFEDRLAGLYKAVREYVRMVVIDLDSDDDPQLIFETLNARGTPLLPADLVKNYLYRRAELEAEDLEPLYKQYWSSFDGESAYWRAEVGRGHARRPRIDTFLQHYLTLQTGEEVSVGNLYAAFRGYLEREEHTRARSHLESIVTYATVYRDFDKKEPTSR
jgi:uncharacterized protein with ParB-like and HNH nuclease domain